MLSRSMPLFKVLTEISLYELFQHNNTLLVLLQDVFYWINRKTFSCQMPYEWMNNVNKNSVLKIIQIQTILTNNQLQRQKLNITHKSKPKITFPSKCHVFLKYTTLWINTSMSEEASFSAKCYQKKVHECGNELFDCCSLTAQRHWPVNPWD